MMMKMNFQEGSFFKMTMDLYRYQMVIMMFDDDEMR